MVSLAAHRLAFFFFFPSSRIKSPTLSQLHPKSKVTGFASFSQLLLGNANADADSSTGFLCGRKDTKLAQALFQKLFRRRELTLLLPSPLLSDVSKLSGIAKPQSQYEKWTFLISRYYPHKNHHLFFYFQPGLGLDSHQPFALPIYFWLPAV